jgi:hypothetical protein
MLEENETEGVLMRKVSLLGEWRMMMKRSPGRAQRRSAECSALSREASSHQSPVE